MKILFLVLFASLTFSAPLRLSTVSDNPIALSHAKPGHPRLWFNTNNLPLLRSHWNDAAYSGVNRYKTANDPVSAALRYLALGNNTDARTAIASAQGLLDTTDGTGDGACIAAWCDIPALVFDWCYGQLTDSQKTDWAAKIYSRMLNAEAGRVTQRFEWHENHFYIPPYLSMVLAIEGEPGIVSHLRQAQNVLQNLQELGDEISGDGGYQAYFYQGRYQPLTFFLWTSATDLDFAVKSSFSKNLPIFALSRLSQDTRRFVRAAGDDAGDSTGNVLDNLRLSAGIFYLLSEHFGDPLAQWLGDKMTAAGQTNHWPSSNDPGWLSFVHYNASLSSLSPSELNLPTTHAFDKIGIVAMRSAWGFSGEQDIVARFYNGPFAAHCEASQNHFSLWRGSDDIVIEGGNYFGSPSVYNERYSRKAISRNVMLFSPTGSAKPDSEGGQVFGQGLQPLSANRYPINNALNWYSGLVSYRGEITYFNDDSNRTIITGDAGIAYDSANVKSYQRDFVYLKPCIFLIRDRFQLANIGSIRSILHSRSKSVVSGSLTLVKGTADSGILETTNNRFLMQQDNSQASATVLWPSQPTLRLVGGSGYEAWVDGADSTAAIYCQPWLKTSSELPLRLGLARNQWRTEIETTPDNAAGNLITAFFVSAKDSAGNEPPFQFANEASGKKITVTYHGKTYQVTFPDLAVPMVLVNPSSRMETLPKPEILLCISPNPANEWVEIRMNARVADPGSMSILVYDLQGRIIRNLAERKQKPSNIGTALIKWDFKDMNNRALSNGIYIIKLISDMTILTRRVILIR